jgi:hypothetical protein
MAIANVSGTKKGVIVDKPFFEFSLLLFEIITLPHMIFYDLLRSVVEN